jgi:hypothetical protein
MSRDIRFDHDSGRYLDHGATLPTPGMPTIDQLEAAIEALPIAISRAARGVYCPTCANGIGIEIEEDGTFGVRSCDCCGEEVRAK